MKSWRSVKVYTPANRSDPCDSTRTDLITVIPRTKVERTTSLWLIHTYGVEDPARLRRLELGTSGVERREEQNFVTTKIGSKEREREGAALQGRKNNFLC